MTSAGNLDEVISTNREYLARSLGTVPKAAKDRQAHSVTLASEECEVGQGIVFEAVLARPSASVPSVHIRSVCPQSVSFLGFGSPTTYFKNL